jgi:Tol biopolymer transport system component
VQLSEGVTISQPVVSPDEEHVAFAHPRKDGKVVGWVVSGATGKVTSEFENPTFDPVSRAMSWMPDSQFFVMADVRTGTSNLWALPVLGGGQEKQLTHFTTGMIWDFAYSPDGKWIAMARGPHQSDAVMFREAK